MADNYRLNLAKLENLSYSNLLTLHSCPRRFELDKRTAINRDGAINENVDFAYGHCLAAGIQDYLVSGDEVSAKFAMFLAWDTDLFNEKPKPKKSIWYAVHAFNIFTDQSTALIGRGWQVAMFNGRPAVELTFKLVIGNGFQYFGHIDIVLYNPSTNKYMVLELKTSSFNDVPEAVYKNSAQALGYSLMLDKIATDIGAAAHYEVLYLPYLTGAQVYKPMVFTKSKVQRAAWIKHLLLDCEIIKLYAEHDFFPMNGESCYAFFRECEYFDLCQLSNKMFPPLISGDVEHDYEEKVDDLFVIQLSDLIDLQIASAS